jgi:hypothetical protein
MILKNKDLEKFGDPDPAIFCWPSVRSITFFQKRLRTMRETALFLFSVVFFCSCASSSYQIIRQKRTLAEFRTTPDRVVTECFLESGSDVKGRYWFGMHFLDDENTVLRVMQTNLLLKEECEERLKAVGKILKTGKLIYVGGSGSLIDPREKDNEVRFFPGHGTFSLNGRVLQFLVIANEKGLCYDAYRGNTPPCPEAPFSIEHLK